MLDVVTPHPFQRGPASGFERSPTVLHMASGNGAVTSACDNFLSVTYSATARRSVPDKRFAMEIMGPVSIAARTRSAAIVRSASRDGARSLPPS